ncbi:purine-nucleoside phosphorylase [Hahella sp. HN01]|uniref:purine-nucleoside phosphorylase n=1 Tax=Hahella sp. HN01 TaxID=2847262 RepID=UPI001C1EAFCF|nr:purine-nucleoside phosphorylase [Hahella sp. HN01]MBU6953350.1 purine-nucleoside phosphorylase [Hahella sp. HN01]
MATPHIAANPGDFADTVLMPGDPLRAKHIAETYLAKPVLVNDVRGMLGYTGEYRGRRLSVMGSGMGVPSISIYAHELYTQFNVKNIVRIGSCGSIRDEVKVRDIVIGMGAGTDSLVNRVRLNHYDFAAIADYDLLEPVVNAARRRETRYHVGALFTTDLFYAADPGLTERLSAHGVKAVEMEAAGLYGVAAACGGKALALCTVSDHLLSGERLSPEERRTSFNDMVEIALEAAVSF